LLKKQWAQVSRYSENNMEIFTIQEVLLLPVDPIFFCERLTFWAMPVAARIVRDLLKATFAATVNMGP
jgi:hypothetical protein